MRIERSDRWARILALANHIDYAVADRMAALPRSTDDSLCATGYCWPGRTYKGAGVVDGARQLHGHAVFAKVRRGCRSAVDTQDAVGRVLVSFSPHGLTEYASGLSKSL